MIHLDANNVQVESTLGILIPRWDYVAVYHKIFLMCLYRSIYLDLQKSINFFCISSFPPYP